MAKRPIFKPQTIPGESLVKVIEVEFEWFPGMSATQKKRSIASLHQSSGQARVLEISSKSEDPIGVALSAFNLMIQTKNGKSFSVEVAFQSSKVFERGGPFTDLLARSSLEARKDERLQASGSLLKFEFFGKDFPLEPKTYFYDWIYINALNQNLSLADQLKNFDAFSDIEFNPTKSINCQARSCALYVALEKQGILIEALESADRFLELAYLNVESKNTTSEHIMQSSLF